MLLINLLPHREAARRRRRQAFRNAMLLSVLAGLLVAGALDGLLWMRLQAQQASNAVLRSEIQALDARIKAGTQLERELASLRARQAAVQELQAQRHLPVRLLGELTRLLPDGVYLTALRQDGMAVTVQGVAQSNERVSELLGQLAEGSPWFARPELQEAVAREVAVTPREKRKAVAFTLRLELTRPADAELGRAARARQAGAGQ